MAITVNKALELEAHGEPPSKKARHLVEKEKESTAKSVAEEENGQKRRTSREKKDAGKTRKTAETRPKSQEEVRTVQRKEDQARAPSDIESEIEQTSVVEGNPDDAVASINGDADGYGTHGILILGTAG